MAKGGTWQRGGNMAKGISVFSSRNLKVLKININLLKFYNLIIILKINEFWHTLAQELSMLLILV